MPSPERKTEASAGGLLARRRVPLILAALFLASVAVRAPNLGRPLGRHHEFLSACVLRIHRIWYDEGALRHRFLPIMTYGGRANLNIDNDARQRDLVGRWYYTPVPPLGYIAPYLVFRLAFVRPGPLALRVFNLALHAISACFVYLICLMLARPTFAKATVGLRSFSEGGRGRKGNGPLSAGGTRGVASQERGPSPFCSAALVGFTVYLFSPATMWFQSNVYFADMFAQPLFIIGAYVLLRLAGGEARPPGRGGARFLHLALGAAVFAMVSSEWIGALFALFACLYAVKHRRRPGMKTALFVIAGAAAAGLAAVALHYSLIDGLVPWLRMAAGRAAARSGASSFSPGGMSYLSWRSWAGLAVNYGAGYLPFLLLAAALGLLVIRSPPAGGSRRRATEGGRAGPEPPTAAAIYLLLAPVAAHHLILFNFTAVHDYAALKTAPAIAVVTALMFDRLAARGGSPPAGGSRRARVTLPPGRGVGALVVAAAVLAVVQYELINWGRRDPPAGGDRHKVVGEEIAHAAGASGDDEVVFVKSKAGRILPQLVYYAGRNVAPWVDEASARRLIEMNGVERGVVFVLTDDDRRVGRIKRIEQVRGPP